MVAALSRATLRCPDQSRDRQGAVSATSTAELFALQQLCDFSLQGFAAHIFGNDFSLAVEEESGRNAGHGIFRGIGTVLKNVFGVILILIGAILSLPGLPGPGLPIVLAGVFLLDFPGKRKLLCKILNRPRLLRSVNRLRRKFSRPPVLIG